ncbi:MAG: hypothetical protein FD126_3029 [Elusimicrobia bacterium]|nr:MAG: hypothetical protein FD126_3029 [Elusimicrobiota bacterium]
MFTYFQDYFGHTGLGLEKFVNEVVFELLIAGGNRPVLQQPLRFLSGGRRAHRGQLFAPGVGPGDGVEADFRDVGGRLFLGEGVLEELALDGAGVWAVVPGGKLGGQGLLGLHRVQGLDRREVRGRQQLVVGQHRLVGDAHDLPEDVAGGLV